MKRQIKDLQTENGDLRQTNSGLNSEILVSNTEIRNLRKQNGELRADRMALTQTIKVMSQDSDYVEQRTKLTNYVKTN